VGIKGNDQEVEFHEIKIHFFMRSKFLIMIWSPNHPFFMRSKSKKSIIRNFNLMINLLSYKYNHEVQIQKSIIRNFDLMIIFFFFVFYCIFWKYSWAAPTLFISTPCIHQPTHPHHVCILGLKWMWRLARNHKKWIFKFTKVCK
jgi:hypothetical protein